VSYFGHHGIHEFAWNGKRERFRLRTVSHKEVRQPAGFPLLRLAVWTVSEMETNLVSNYNGMVISLDRRFASGLLQLNYTYSHGLDEVSNGGYNYFTYSSSPSLQDPVHPRDGYGAADYDVRHLLNANYVWDLPLKRMLHSHGPDTIVRGWQVSGTVFARTAFPYTVLDIARHSRNQNTSVSFQLSAVGNQH